MQGEGFRQRVHHSRGNAAYKTHLLQFDDEARLLIGRVRHHVRKRDKARHGLDIDRTIPRDDARTKLNGGNVPLTRGTQAHDKAQAALGDTTLIRMRHHRRIEQSGGLQRILTGKQRANQKLPHT